MVEVLAGMIGGLIVGYILFVLFRKNSGGSVDDVTEAVGHKLNEMYPQLARDLTNVAEKQLGAEKREIKTDLENKRSEIERLIKVMQQDLKDSKANLEKSEKERIGSFNALKSSLDDYKKVTDQLSVSTENLRKVLSNNQLRGQFGEQVADDLLKMAGFVRGVDYEFNKEQAGSETRPDFAVFLPDGTRINVDSKFPYSNLQKMTETDDKEAKVQLMAQFTRDVKEKIKQVTSRDYINPDDKTVDFVILFIPNEMIFSFIYDKLNEVWTEAMEKKVILAGPFSFTALLRMIKQSYENFRVQANIHKIVDHVRAVEKEFDKFSSEFTKVGDRIQSLEKQYNMVSSTRMNQIVRKMDKVKLEDGSQKEDDQQAQLLD